MKKKKQEMPVMEKPEQTEESASETMVVSWGPFNKGGGYYQFPPGLYGVSEIHSSDDQLVFLKDDGTLQGWSVGGYVGGHSSFHQHLSKLKNVARVKWRHWAPYRLASLYIWFNNGECELHEPKEIGTTINIEVVPLGNQVVDIITNHNLTIIVTSKGELILMYSHDIHIGEENPHVETLLKRINNEHSQKLLKYKKGYLFTGESNDGAAILWQDTMGRLHYEKEGKIQNVGERKGRTSLPKKLDPVDDVAPCDNGDYGNNFIILRNGKVTALDLFNSIEKDIPEATALKSIKSPIKKIKCPLGARDNSDAVMVFSESGKTLLITAKPFSDFRPARRDRFKKSAISPQEYEVIDAIAHGQEVIGIIRKTAPKNLHVKNTKTKKSSNLFIWGKGSPHQKVEIAKKPDLIGKILDIVVYNLGWICLKEDGGLYGIDADNEGNIIPPWFPDDFIAIEIENGIKATRKNGEIWKWGESKHISAAWPVTLEELEKAAGNSATDHLVPPKGLKNCSKVLKVGDLVVALDNSL